MNSTATATQLQNAAEQRRSQAVNTQTTQQAGAQYNFAEIFGGAAWGQTEDAAKPSASSTSTTSSSRGGFDSAIATATATVVDAPAADAVVENGSGGREPVTTPVATQPTTGTGTATTSAAGNSSAELPDSVTTATAAATIADSTSADSTATSTTAAAVTTPGVQALVADIMNGSFQPTYVTNPAQLQETNPAGTDTMPNFYYASDQTATQLAQLLGGTVVQRPAFGQDQGWSEPNANFIQLPDGQTFNAADVAYYANAGPEGATQLTSDITATINEGSAWTNYYEQGGAMPTFSEGYVGPPIDGSTYAANMISANGNVINPAMQQSGVSGT
jgi:hypothetical protein